MRPVIALSALGLLVTITTACGTDGSGITPPSSEPGPVPSGITDPSWAVLGSACTADAPAPSLPEARRSGLPPFTGGEQRTSDDDMADLARTVPGGWGGHFKDGTRTVIYLVDVSREAEAIAALRQQTVVRVGTVGEARQGRWDFVQLADWYRLLLAPAWGVRGVVGSHIDERWNRLEFAVTDAAARAALEAELRRHDLPCYLVAIRVEGN